MTVSIEIPNEVLGAFNRLLNKVPPEARNDPKVQRSLLVFLKVGGERLAKQYVAFNCKPFELDFDVVKKRAVEEPVRETEAVQADPKTEDATETESGTGDAAPATDDTAAEKDSDPG